MKQDRWQNMKTAAVLVSILLMLFMIPGCSEFNRNDPADHAGHKNDGIEIPGDTPSDPNGDGGQMDETGSNDEGSDDKGNNAGSVCPGDSHDMDKGGNIGEKLKKMDLDEKIGQMFIIGIEGTSVDEEIKHIITSRHPGGIILFRHNINDPGQLLELVNGLKAVNSGKIPLFISIDEEGGRISRLPDQLMAIPSAMSTGELDDEMFTYEAGRLIAAKIKAFGFNMDFAPVLDILSNPDNTVIGDRAFGSTAQTVAKHGVQIMKGIRDEGIIPVAKHFPGHGDTDVDSHSGLPKVAHGMDRLAGFELLPFQKALDEKADALMVAHIVLTSLDPDFPASLSSAVISGLLRNEMGFEGVVITDDMTMGAITENFDTGEAAVRSVNAGCDIILVCNGYDRQLETMDAVKQAVETGLISESRIDESVVRILKLKDKYDLSDNIVGHADVEGLNEKIEGVLSKWYNDN